MHIDYKNIVINTVVLERVYDLYKDDMSKENGGVIIGYMKDKSIFIKDIIPSGVQAKRSSVSLFQDGRWQANIFQEIVQHDDEIEHIGSFHHHVSVGYMPYLSNLDLKKYRGIIKDEGFKYNSFVSILLHTPIKSLKDLKNFFSEYCNVFLVTSNDVTKVENITFEDSREISHEIIDELKDKDITWYMREPYIEYLKFLTEEQGYCAFKNKDDIKLKKDCVTIIASSVSKDKLFIVTNDESDKHNSINLLHISSNKSLLKQIGLKTKRNGGNCDKF